MNSRFAKVETDVSRASMVGKLVTLSDSLKVRWHYYLPAGSLRARLAAGAIWTLIGSVAAQAITALASIVLARLLGRVSFGELAILRNTQMMFTSFALFGLGATANKHLAEWRISDVHRAGRVVGMSYVTAFISGLIMTAAIFIFAAPLARYALNAPHLAYYLRISAPLLLLGAITGVQYGALSGLEAFRRMSVGTTVASIATAVLSVVGVLINGLEGAVWGSLCGGVFGFVVLHFVVASEYQRAGVRVIYGLHRSERLLLWSFALPSLLAGLTVVPPTWLANLILVNTPNGYAEMGLFSAANQWRTLLLFLPTVISVPLLPIMVQLQANGEWARLRRLLAGCMAGNALLVGGCAFALALAAVPIMSLYGNGFEVGAPVLITMLVVAVFLAVGTVVGQLMVSTGKMWFGVTVNLIWGVVLVASTALFVPRQGALGLGLAYVAAYAIHTLLQIAYFWRRFGLMKRIDISSPTLQTEHAILAQDT